MFKKTMYNPPTVRESAYLEAESALLASSGDLSGTLRIDGQQTDGYFESDDIGADWGWD